MSVSDDSMSPLVVVVVTAASVIRVFLSGDIDPSNHEELVRALTGVDSAGASAVHVNLSGVTSSDLEGVQHLLAFARTVRESGRAVVFDGASGEMGSMLRLLGTEAEVTGTLRG
jgi:anti-anti-sigma regulatory factor